METTHVYKTPTTSGDPFTVGYYEPSGKWYPVSDHKTEQEAAARVHYLNGGNTPHAPELLEALKPLLNPHTTIHGARVVSVEAIAAANVAYAKATSQKV